MSGWSTRAEIALTTCKRFCGSNVEPLDCDFLRCHFILLLHSASMPSHFYCTALIDCSLSIHSLTNREQLANSTPSRSLLPRNRTTSTSTNVTSARSNLAVGFASAISPLNSSRCRAFIRPTSRRTVALPSASFRPYTSRDEPAWGWQPAGQANCCINDGRRRTWIEIRDQTSA
jgi:hypothetical protein